MRVQSRIVRRTALNERQPAPRRHYFSKLHLLAEELLLRGRCGRRNGQGRAHLPRESLSRRKTRQFNPTSVTLMKPLLRILIVAGVFSLIAPTSRGDSEIVLAIRYLQAQGTSHSHLYLFRGDGKLLGQLTSDNAGQDSGLIFAPDGATIVFTREKPGNVREFWSIDPRGTGLKKLEAAPDWYIQAKSSPYFTNVEPEESASPIPTASSEESASPAETPPPSYKSPDGSVELILREDP